MASEKGASFGFGLREVSGALGDLGTLLPLMLGAIVVGGMAPVPVLTGFALFYLITALHYRLPIPVQPMKAVAAVLLTVGVTPESLAASGVLMGLVLLGLGLTGWITRLARLVPRSILAGLQLGLGVALATVGVELIAGAPLIGGAVLLILLAFIFLAPAWPAALIGLALAVTLGQAFGSPGSTLGAGLGPIVWNPAPAIPDWPSLAAVERALAHVVLPQLSLTLTNAVVLTALIAGDYFGERARHVTPARLSITSGLANLLMAPFGAMPMCHGAGGLAAHHRFGARSGTTPLLLGLGLLLLAVLPGGAGLAALAAIPAAGLGALLVTVAGELALTKRLVDSKPSCWPVIAATAAVTIWIDPFWGLMAGTASELARTAILRALRVSG